MRWRTQSIEKAKTSSFASTGALYNVCTSNLGKEAETETVYYIVLYNSGILEVDTKKNITKENIHTVQPIISYIILKRRHSDHCTKVNFDNMVHGTW